MVINKLCLINHFEWERYSLYNKYEGFFSSESSYNETFRTLINRVSASIYKNSIHNYRKTSFLGTATHIVCTEKLFFDVISSLDGFCFLDKPYLINNDIKIVGHLSNRFIVGIYVPSKKRKIIIEQIGNYNIDGDYAIVYNETLNVGGIIKVNY